MTTNPTTRPSSPTRTTTSCNRCAVDAATVYVLGSDGKLWLEHAPFGTVPPKREQVDANVAGPGIADFGPLHAMDAATVYVLGSDGKVWLEHGPFGTVPPKREQVDTDIVGFRAVDAATAYVLQEVIIGPASHAICNLFQDVGPFHNVRGNRSTPPLAASPISVRSMGPRSTC